MLNIYLVQSVVKYIGVRESGDIEEERNSRALLILSLHNLGKLINNIIYNQMPWYNFEDLKNNNPTF